MRYISWAAFYEGPSDASYLDVLLPRVIRDLVANEGVVLVDVPEAAAVKLGAKGRAVDDVAAEACEFADAFDIVFIHADTGGRGQERTLENRSEAYCEAMARMCSWPIDRCITITPRHETEAWLLADNSAVTSALGYRGNPNAIGLPSSAAAAERLRDPKEVLRSAIEQVAGRRRSQNVANIFPAIAQRQDFTRLRQSGSFVTFEARLKDCLRSLQCLR